MRAPEEIPVATPPSALRGVALACGVAGVLLAIAAPYLAAWHENIEGESGVLATFDKTVLASHTFGILFWVYTLLGAAAVACALGLYVRGILGRNGRLALVLGIAALAWKFTLYLLVIAIVIWLLVAGLSSGAWS